jgi:hypothetical protein
MFLSTIDGSERQGSNQGRREHLIPVAEKRLGDIHPQLHEREHREHKRRKNEQHFDGRHARIAFSVDQLLFRTSRLVSHRFALQLTAYQVITINMPIE